MSRDNTKEPLTPEMMESMLEEISNYSIDLEEDPTLPHLGLAYLQRIVSQCRSYSNRVTFYMQKVKRYENRLRSELKILELDLEFKMAEKLADDVLVRKQSSIEDRRAVAMTMLSDEHHRIAELKVHIQDVEETSKIIKMKHQELLRTSTDIKTQRNLVKDDMLVRLGGHEGYIKPQTGVDKSVPDGLPPPVSAPVNPVDLLRTAPEPKPFPAQKPADQSSISNFFNKTTTPKITRSDESDDILSGDLAHHFDSSLKQEPNGFDVEQAKADLMDVEKSFEKKMTGTYCSVCKEPQFTSFGGDTCENGHGGAPPAEKQEMNNKIEKTVSYEDLL